MTWTTHKEHVAQVIRGVETHKVAGAFLNFAAGYEGTVPGGWDGLFVNGVGTPTAVRDGLRVGRRRTIFLRYRIALFACFS
jgi:hypothetical protein